MKLKTILINLTPPIIVKAYRDARYGPEKPSLTPFVHPILNSYSQYYEDLILDVIFAGKTKGFYIDVGANDPYIISNTKRFYDKGWSGINIEPNLLNYHNLCQYRERDINLNIGLGDHEAMLIFYETDPHTLSTFSSKSLNEAKRNYKFTVILEKEVPVFPLSKIFSDHVGNRKVDFLSLDVEGYEREVIAGNNWNTNRPTIVMIEMNQGFKPIIETMEEVNYILIFSNTTNGIFIDRDQIPENGF